MEQKGNWKMWLIGWLPDLGLSWVYMNLSDDKWSSFWWCLLALTVIQFFFIFKQIVSGSLIFHLFAKDRLSEAMAKEMRERKYPPPQKDEDFESYMYRLITDDTLSTDVRIGANGSLGAFQAIKAQGFFASLRTTAAFDYATNKYLERY